MLQILTARLKTVAPVWTGGVDRESSQARETGLAGSLRWWYEALVRGLGGYACDPTAVDDRCFFNEAAFQATGEVEDGLRDVCPACRLFGCTGWSSKFNFRLADAQGRMPVELGREGVTFQMRFVEVKPLAEEERWLLSRVLHLIDRYGSLGGRTTLKPPEQPDYGVVEVRENIPAPELSREEVARRLAGLLANSADMQRRQAAQPSQIPRLDLFFFNDDHWLDLRAINDLMQVDSSGFLAGKIGVSKKIFSFRVGNRFWGYAADRTMLTKVMDRLAALGVRGTKKGEVVINEL